MNKATKRVQFELPERSLSRLQELKEKTESASYTEVVKNALRLYEAVISETEMGHSFLVKDKEGNLKEYVVF